MPARIAIVGDFNPGNRIHISTNYAIEHGSAGLGLQTEFRWVGTDKLAADGLNELAAFTGFWIAPGSPYKNMTAALSAIRMAREQRIPLLGTCGGFQHLILEFARNVLNFADAEHEETAPQASRLFISRLSCSLVGRTMSITLQPDSLAARSYGRTRIQEQYHCNFGVNPEYENVLHSSALRIVGSDDEGVVRVVELSEHPFFIGTLFVPQMTTTLSAPHPLISSFIRACSAEHAVA